MNKQTGEQNYIGKKRKKYENIPGQHIIADYHIPDFL